MLAERMRQGWLVPWMAAVLCATGCATLTAPPAQGNTHGSPTVLREDIAAGSLSAQPPHADFSREKRARVRLRRRHGARVKGMDGALVSPVELAQHEAASSAPVPRGPPSCGGQAVPEGWPDYSSWLDGELLAPFFKCASPVEFLELQRRVDMPRLMEAVEDWSAVRLGALGPMEDRAAQVLQRKRFSFLVSAAQRYGAYAPVLVLFLVDTAFDDEVRELLVLLARDKQLAQTLVQMEPVREALARRGFQIADYPDRDEQLSDVLRGLGRAAADVASTIPAVDGARGDPYGMRAELPPPYQEAMDATREALTREHFAPGHVALGTFDYMTFGVPLGFYSLVAGTGHGVKVLTQGQYEQAARELAPAALLVGLYAGGKGVRYLSRAKGGAGTSERGVGRQVPELRWRALKDVVERLRLRLGEEGLGQLARYIQAQREAAILVGAGGEPAAMALYEARGNVARAQAVLSQARPEAGGAHPAKPSTAQPSRGVAASKELPPIDVPIRNAHLAGKRHPVTGVPFDADGYPDFRAAGVVRAEVKITYIGSRTRDFAAANAAAGLRETPKGMTWHHHQDRTTMQLVPTETHAKTGHTGGFSGDR